MIFACAGLPRGRASSASSSETAIPSPFRSTEAARLSPSRIARDLEICGKAFAASSCSSNCDACASQNYSSAQRIVSIAASVFASLRKLIRLAVAAGISPSFSVAISAARRRCPRLPLPTGTGIPMQSRRKANASPLRAYRPGRASVLGWVRHRGRSPLSRRPNWCLRLATQYRIAGL